MVYPFAFITLHLILTLLPRRGVGKIQMMMCHVANALNHGQDRLTEPASLHQFESVENLLDK